MKREQKTEATGDRERDGPPEVGASVPEVVHAGRSQPEHQALQGIETGELGYLNADGREGDEQGRDPRRQAAGDRSGPQEHGHDQQAAGDHRGHPGHGQALAEPIEEPRDDHGVEPGAIVQPFGNPGLAVDQPAVRREHGIHLVEFWWAAEVDQPDQQGADKQRQNCEHDPGRRLGRSRCCAETIRLKHCVGSLDGSTPRAARGEDAVDALVSSTANPPGPMVGPSWA